MPRPRLSRLDNVRLGRHCEERSNLRSASSEIASQKTLAMTVDGQSNIVEVVTAPVNVREWQNHS